MNSYKVLSLNESMEWKIYLKRLPLSQQDVYFTPEYYSLYEKYDDGKALCFVYEKDGEIALYPFLINSINKLGYVLDKEYFDIQGAYGYNGVVSSTESKQFIRSFYETFYQYCVENSIVAEFTRFHPLIGNQLYSDGYMDIIFNRKTVAVSLEDDLESIFSKFSKSNKRAIKKAEKNDIRIEVLCQNYNIDSFKALYLETMKRVNSNDYLLFSDSYFRQLFGLDDIVQFNAFYGDELIASTVCFYSVNYFHYHLGCSNSEFLEFRPNNRLFKSMIIHAKSLGCNYLYLGGGNTSNSEDSLLRYKSSFSDKHHDFFIGKKVHLADVYKNIIKQFETMNSKLYEENRGLILGYRNIKQKS